MDEPEIGRHQQHCDAETIEHCHIGGAFDRARFQQSADGHRALEMRDEEIGQFHFGLADKSRRFMAGERDRAKGRLVAQQANRERVDHAAWQADFAMIAIGRRQGFGVHLGEHHRHVQG